mmetsp:Transcript_30697/g.75307  ORF Transcript_30697/g.75307 Transcript_30697/m.75307 type:complete len:260 (-) Transcript_30697:380-1159(-)
MSRRATKDCYSAKRFHPAGPVNHAQARDASSRGSSPSRVFPMVVRNRQDPCATELVQLPQAIVIAALASNMSHGVSSARRIQQCPIAAELVNEAQAREGSIGRSKPSWAAALTVGIRQDRRPAQLVQLPQAHVFAPLARGMSRRAAVTQSCPKCPLPTYLVNEAQARHASIERSRRSRAAPFVIGIRQDQRPAQLVQLPQARGFARTACYISRRAAEARCSPHCPLPAELVNHAQARHASIVRSIPGWAVAVVVGIRED